MVKNVSLTKSDTDDVLDIIDLDTDQNCGQLDFSNGKKIVRNEVSFSEPLRIELYKLMKDPASINLDAEIITSEKEMELSGIRVSGEDETDPEIETDPEPEAINQIENIANFLTLEMGYNPEIEYK